MMFRYKSPVGAFSIRPTMSGRWLLSVDDRELASFASPQAAADAVSSRMTGHPDWDCLFKDNVPLDLDDWEIVA